MPADPMNIACALVRQVEGLQLDAYPDPLSKGEPWAYGYGCTSTIGGVPVRPGDCLSSTVEADTLLLHVLGILAIKLRGLVRVPMAPCQEAALLSWQFNLGSSRIAGSTLLRLLNAGDGTAAADQFLAWDKGHVAGMLVTVPALLRRRKLERSVFLGLVDPVGSASLAARGALAAGSTRLVQPAAAPAADSTDGLNDAELAQVRTTDMLEA